MQQRLVSTKRLTVAGGIEAGVIFLPGKYERKDTTIGAYGLTKSIKMGAGFGYMAGVHFTAGFKISRLLDLSLNLQPRYYHFSTDGAPGYFTSNSNGIYTSIGNGVGSVTLIPQARLSYHVFAFPVSVGICFKL